MGSLSKSLFQNGDRDAGDVIRLRSCLEGGLYAAEGGELLEHRSVE